MIVVRNFLKEITTPEAAVFTLVGQNPNGVTVMLQNRDTINYISYRFQKSTVNVSDEYEDIANSGGNFGVSGVLTPGGVAMVNIRETDPYIRMVASSSGGALLESILTQFAADTSDTFNAGTL